MHSLSAGLPIRAQTLRRATASAGSAFDECIITQTEEVASFPLARYHSSMATSLSARVAASRERLKAAGGRAIPRGMLQPDAAQALAELLAAGYAPSETGVISTALLDAQKKLNRAAKKHLTLAP